MSAIEIQGLHPLKGEVRVQGSKNAALPLAAAAVLNKGTVVLKNVPRIQDMFCMVRILEAIGCSCRFEGNCLTIQADVLTRIAVPRSYVTAMRSSIVILGALLGRCGEAATYYPGGCSIGSRPINLHLYGLKCLGARICELGDEKLVARAERLRGARILLPFPSVGATENVLMAAVLASGTTVLSGAAMEPEIGQLCRFLNSMGARISGIGTGTLRIEGVEKLHDTEFTVAGDRIVAGTYLSCVMAAGGRGVLRGADGRELEKVLKTFRLMGADICARDGDIAVSMEKRPAAADIKTGPYPEFPTDLQSPFLALLSAGIGTGTVCETVFEGRFATAEELRKMGALISIHENRAWVTGRYPLKGSVVKATDLRGGAALAVAGLAAEGVTRISGCGHIFRGYEDICRDLKDLGANVRLTALSEAEADD